MKEDKELQIKKYARDIMELARDTIIVRFRFFDVALGRINLTEKSGLKGFVMADGKLYYDPEYLLMIYLDEPGIAVRVLLHVLLHMVFLHPFRQDRQNADYWDMATDIAVENIILEMDISAAALTRDDEQRGKISRIKKWCSQLTADRLYREFLINGISSKSREEYTRLFSVDIHNAWRAKTEDDELMISEEDWKKISERIKADLKTFSKDKSGSDSLDTNIDEATKKRYDFDNMLRRFAISGEEICVNDDEFDYVYYTYGLRRYGNLPLIEPLEYAEVNKVKEFVIALDTSGSCRGAVVKEFLQRTYDILKATENFFHTVNIHIIQCDASIRSDTKIKSDADFKDFIKNGKLNGFGATDFRPVFSYVQELIEQKEFDNLKGMIYFTDGYGIYPENMPAYDVIFAFIDEDKYREPVPNWAIKAVLDSSLV